MITRPGDTFAAETARRGDDDALRAILAEVCRTTGMGFAAIARVTEARWIACQVLDRIEFGLEPGDELQIATTICNDIRECGNAVVIDHVAADAAWRTHPTPMLYGFESYASFPIVLEDGTFFGTLCAIDPAPHAVSSATIVNVLEGCARSAARILSAR
ncbi:GAF domain-containing protein [Sphingomonas sp.]|uniref:GAF domain-containing protein n=1 Tax=Sphingomonas sp. TaxID=28214 RepID=UPI0035BBD781